MGLEGCTLSNVLCDPKLLSFAGPLAVKCGAFMGTDQSMLSSLSVWFLVCLFCCCCFN